MQRMITGSDSEAQELFAQMKRILNKCFTGKVERHGSRPTSVGWYPSSCSAVVSSLLLSRPSLSLKEMKVVRKSDFKFSLSLSQSSSAFPLTPFESERRHLTMSTKSKRNLSAARLMVQGKRERVSVRERERKDQNCEGWENAENKKTQGKQPCANSETDAQQEEEEREVIVIFTLDDGALAG